MTDTNAAMPTLTITILSSQCLVWLGLQNVLESSSTVPMVVHPNQWRTADGAPQSPDQMCSFLTWRPCATPSAPSNRFGSQPQPARSCCCAGLRTRTARARRLPMVSTA